MFAKVGNFFVPLPLLIAIKITDMSEEIIRIKESEYHSIQLHAVAVLPWSHNLLLMSKKFNDGETLFYAREIIGKGWDRK